MDYSHRDNGNERFLFSGNLLDQTAEARFVESFSDVLEAITQGEDEAKALILARHALETALEFYAAHF